MRRSTPRSRDRMDFPLTLGAHLRRLFDDVVSSPLPRRVADLMRRVKSDETNAREGTEHEDRGNR
jgi:hypothetical protein